ncbi:MAG: hypothetical protein RLZZ205_906, partial [Bacteroidota bacterium]
NAVIERRKNNVCDAQIAYYYAAAAFFFAACLLA